MMTKLLLTAAFLILLADTAFADGRKCGACQSAFKRDAKEHARQRALDANANPIKRRPR